MIRAALRPSRLAPTFLILILAVPIVFNAVALAPELTAVPSVNDDAAHWAFVQRADDAISRGENPVDFWFPGLELGFPQFAYYQHLPHLAVVAIHRALPGSDLLATFNAVRYLLLVTFPLTVFVSLRVLGLGTSAAAIGAAVAPLLSSGSRLGFDYDSYIWRGYGVFTQLFAMHLSLLALALTHRVMAIGRGYAATIAAFAALVLTHILYAYMLALTAGLLVLAELRPRAIPVRMVRLAVVGTATAVITAYMSLPAVQTAYYLNDSPFLEGYKYDSFGAGPILGWLVTGQLLDAGRPPILTALLAVGITVAVVTRRRLPLLALAIFLFWLVLYFGRPTLGSIVDLLPLHESLFFHRFIGGVHIAAIILIGIGGGWLWDRLRPTRHPGRAALAAMVAGLLFVPILLERKPYYDDNAAWLGRTVAAIAADADAQTVLAMLGRLPPGRTYAGMTRQWGDQLDFGLPFRSVKLRDLLPYTGHASFGPAYQGPSLNSDLAWYFDERSEAHYAVFGIDTVIAPTTIALPSFLVPLRATPLYVLYAAPGRVARYAGITERVSVTTQRELFERMRAWLVGPGPAAGTVVRFDYHQAVDPAAGNAAISACPSGTVDVVSTEPSRITLDVSCPTTSGLVFAVTYHPNWRVTADGTELATFMAAPSEVGVTVPAGAHRLVAEYRSTPVKGPLLILGGVVLLAVIWGDRRLTTLDQRLAARLGVR